jgi:hypothetical protein
MLPKSSPTLRFTVNSKFTKDHLQRHRRAAVVLLQVMRKLGLRSCVLGSISVYERLEHSYETAE